MTESPHPRPIPTVLLIALALGLLAALGAGPSPTHAAEFRLGAGLHYWNAAEDLIDDRLEEDGLGGVITLQYVPDGLFRLGLDVEILPDGFPGANDSEALAPVAFVMVGRSGLYAGLGVGVTFGDGGGSPSDPFYVGRLGFDFEIVPSVHLDVHADYRADAVSELDSPDVDTITVGAAVRFAF
ncbi:MAG: hypothetical protein AAF772_10435 [Acidobacteriota bacterium]